MRTGWRIVPANHAASAFDGEGARLYGGRWNPVGIPLVYASEHLSLAALEVRVHIEKTSLSRAYCAIAFHFDANLIEALPHSALPKDWREQPPGPLVQEIGRRWVQTGKSLILAVPSVLIPSEVNYLINPRHPNFSKLKIDPPIHFAFDERLFR